MRVTGGLLLVWSLLLCSALAFLPTPLRRRGVVAAPRVAAPTRPRAAPSLSSRASAAARRAPPPLRSTTADALVAAGVEKGLGSGEEMLLAGLFGGGFLLLGAAYFVVVYGGKWKSPF